MTSITEGMFTSRYLGLWAWIAFRPMHEMGIANSVLTAVRTAMRRVPGSYPSKVGLRIGQMAAIDQEALRFCFEAITRDTDLEKLILEIEFRPLRYRCRSCGREFAVQDYEIQCPDCTLERLPRHERVAVLTGDIQTDNDAARLRRFHFPVKQITTGGTCHLDARMIERHLADWNWEDLDLLFIENVGNLVCPSSYDLGEHAKVVLLSVTEGEDKPLKYPSIFFKSRLLILTKTDLLPHVPFDIDAAEENARRVHPEIEVVKVSCLTGNGMEDWMKWLEEQRRAEKSDSGTLAGVPASL